MSNPPAGALFIVRSVERFETDDRVIANYIPELCPYRVTLTNAEFVGSLIEQGKAAVVAFVGASKRHPAGFVKVDAVAS